MMQSESYLHDRSVNGLGFMQKTPFNLFSPLTFEPI